MVATQLSSIRSSLDSLSASLEVIAINTEPPSQLEKIKDDFISNALWSALGLDGAQRRTSIGILSALGFCFSLVRFVHFLNTAGKRRRQGEVAVSMSMGGGVIVTVFLVLISALLAGVVFQASRSQSRDVARPEAGRLAQIQATLEDQRTKLLPELLDGIRETNGRLDDLEKACTGQLEPADLSNLSAQVVAVHLATIEHAKRTARRGAQDLQTLLLLATVCASGWLIWKRRR